MRQAQRAGRGRGRWLALALAVLMVGVVAVVAVVVGVLVERTDSSAQSPGANESTSTSGTVGDSAEPTVGSGPSGTQLVDTPAASPAPTQSGGLAEVPAPWPPPADPTGPVGVAVADAASVGVRQAVVVIDRATGATLTQVDQDRAFPSLSMVKLMIAADVLITDDGPAYIDPTTRTMLSEMISRSDDVAASDLYVQVGGDEMVERIAQRFGLAGTSPSPNSRYWGNVQITAADTASLLVQLLADPVIAPIVGADMLAATPIAADGIDQQFGMLTIPGAGSKQGWGCCLGGVLGLHSAGFTTDRIVVVLSSAEPDDYSLGSRDGLALQADPGAQVSIAAVTATVRAALGAP